MSGERSRRRPRHGGGAEGFTLAEALVVSALLALAAALLLQGGREVVQRAKVEAAIRRLAAGLESGRAIAQRLGRPCSLALTEAGWSTEHRENPPGCRGGDRPLSEGFGGDDVLVRHNLPEVVRFSSNGLVIDGGTVVVAAAGTDLRRCLVVALPLGVSRLGRYGGDPEAPPASGSCLPDPAL